MKRSEGVKSIKLIECVNSNIGKYRIRWDIQPKEISEDGNEIVTFCETDLVKIGRLNMFDIQNAVISAINSSVDEKILSGFVWKEMPIWLSSENQFNYKAAYDLTLQSMGKTLPVTFKFGSMNKPIYYKFETIEELSEFYISAMKFISDTLSEGWIMKDSIIFDEYEQYLNQLNKK